MRKRLEACAGLSPSELASIQASVEEDLGDARRKQRIMQAIAEEFDLRADAPDLRQNVFRLLQAFYPDAPLLPEEVEIVLTATLLFFCVPFQGTQLTTSRFDKLPKSEREPIEAFLGKSSHTPLSQFAHFPMFGHFRGTDADAGLLERLATRSGVACEVVARELSCMVTILPLAEVDKFIVHDVWGHGWQASMLQFESLYVRMSTYGEPLALETTAQLSSGETLKLGGCFQQSSSTVVLDEARFSSFIEAEIAERIPVAFSAALAEIMADVGEFKFLTLHPGAEELLPSSSLFKMFPSKLDLILQDMSLYYELATRLFRDGLGVSSERDRLVQALVERGATPESARAAVDQAAASWRTLSESVYAPRLEWTVENDVAMEVNLFTRLALNLLGIHRAICTAYRDLDEIQLRDLPLKSFKDLLVIAASVFFEIDPRRNLWRVDEFLTLVFVPWCCRFGAKR
jgi:hypothetical protein